MNEAIQHEPSTDVVVTTVAGQVTPTHYSDSPDTTTWCCRCCASRPGAATRIRRRSWGRCTPAATASAKNYSIALAFLRRAADKGHPLALYNLGVIYAHGYGIDVNPEVAFNCYAKAAERGSLDGLNNLGVCYQHGFGCVRNLNLAFEKFREAAERGYVISMSNCGYMKELGLGTDLDEEEALRYYRSAAGRGCVEAAYNLGRLYIFTKTFYNDFSLGRETLHKAAKMGSGDACNLLGCIAYKGFKVKRDYEQAREFFLQAERLGNAAARNNLAWLYQHGYGVPADLAKAVHYYTESAARGYSSAQCNLGYLYFHGLGVEKNMPKAFELFGAGGGRGEHHRHVQPGAAASGSGLRLPRHSPGGVPAQEMRAGGLRRSPRAARGNPFQRSARCLSSFTIRPSSAPSISNMTGPSFASDAARTTTWSCGIPRSNRITACWCSGARRCFVSRRARTIPSPADLRSLTGPELGPGDPLRIGDLQFSLAHSSRTVAVPEVHSQGSTAGASEGDAATGTGEEASQTALLLRTLPGIYPGRGGQACGVGGPCQTQPVSQVQRPARNGTRAPKAPARPQKGIAGGGTEPDRVMKYPSRPSCPLIGTAGGAFSVQRHAAPDVGRHVQVFALVDGRLALVETAFGDNLQRQLALPHRGCALSRTRATPALPRQQLLHLVRR